MPEENYADRFACLQSGRLYLTVLRPARYSLNRIAYVLNKGIRIQTNKSDLAKLKSCTELANARLKAIENIKINPRIIVHARRNDIKRN